MTRAIVLIDGEHYPPVVAAALEELARQGLDVQAALFLGGAEKTGVPPELAVPVHVGGLERLAEAITMHRPDIVVELSDEPVLDPRTRLAAAGIALAHGVGYRSGETMLEAPPRPRLTEIPSVSVFATGKRTGKTALAIELARAWKRAGHRPVIVTMGRGGPPEPTICLPGDLAGGVEALRALAEAGHHAASDHIEDAVLAGVPTVGTRRAGAGLAGTPVVDAFAHGVRAALELGPDRLVFEGSGTAIPPARADANILVLGSRTDPEFVRGYLGPYRLQLADAIVAADLSAELAVAVRETRPEVKLLDARFRAEPMADVAGRKVLVVTTAPETAVDDIASDIAALGAASVGVIPGLGDRRTLADRLSGAPTADLVLVEIKAAAVDIVVPWARERGMDVGFLHNRIEPEGGIDALLAFLEDRWRSTR